MSRASRFGCREAWLLLADLPPRLIRTETAPFFSRLRRLLHWRGDDDGDHHRTSPAGASAGRCIVAWLLKRVTVRGGRGVDPAPGARSRSRHPPRRSCPRLDPNHVPQVAGSRDHLLLPHLLLPEKSPACTMPAARRRAAVDGLLGTQGGIRRESPGGAISRRTTEKWAVWASLRSWEARPDAS